jgi:hypothetical protein
VIRIEIGRRHCLLYLLLTYSRRFVPDAERRVELEGRLGRWPVFRHWASVLAVEARRRPETRS